MHTSLEDMRLSLSIFVTDQFSITKTAVRFFGFSALTPLVCQHAKCPARAKTVPIILKICNQKLSDKLQVLPYNICAVQITNYTNNCHRQQFTMRLTLLLQSYNDTSALQIAQRKHRSKCNKC